MEDMAKYLRSRSTNLECPRAGGGWAAHFSSFVRRTEPEEREEPEEPEERARLNGAIS